ncbi:MAG: hypothetical protein IJ367_01830, partial [Clostridia bacterium]|nr:hypothetical protein [Clostridia bacterium]
MKKLLSLLVALTMLVSMMSSFAVSAAENTTVFYNAADDSVITSLDDVDSIYATTTFTGRYEDNASVIVSHYDFNGKLLKVESIVAVDSTIGAEVSYKTPVISVEGTDIVKILAWTGVDTIKPLLQNPGVISRSIPLPTATATVLDVATITDVPLTYAMNFKADPVTQAQLLAYGNWYADYELKINTDVTFNLDGTKDGYLAGQYDSWSPAWVTVPKKDITLPANTPLKIMETGAETYGEPGLKYTYQEVYDRVKDFDCGVLFSEEFLSQNPDIYVTLELRIYNPLDESQSYLINEETYEFGVIPEDVEAVDYTNAPYAGVYEVTSDKDVTLTNETGHTVTLAAGATDYFYLIKGNNNITGIDDATLTFTALEGNGMDYLAEVDAGTAPISTLHTYMGPTAEGTNVVDYYVSADGTVGVGADYVQIAAGSAATFEVTMTEGNAGIYYLNIQLNDNNTNTVRIETSTGHYGEIGQYQWGWNYLFAQGTTDIENVYLREGLNTITVINNGSAPATVGGIRLSRTSSLVGNADYDDQLNLANCKVILEGEEPVA